MSDPLRPSIVVLKGSDEVLLGTALTELLEELVGAEDRSLLVEELTVEQHITADDDGYDIGRLLDAAQTPPFLTDRRIVLARHAGVFSTKELVAPLVSYLSDPLTTTILVLIWEKDPRPQRAAKVAAVPKSLTDAIGAANGVVVDTSAGTGQARRAWFDDQLKASALRFDSRASEQLAAHLGDEMGRLPGVLTTLEGVFAPGTKVTAEDMEPFLGSAGDVVPWELTDSIDKGDVPGSLALLQRMLVGGSKHPIQVFSVLSTHYLKMLEVESPEIRGEKMAAERLGIVGKQSTYPAKKALAGAQRLGAERLGEFVTLLAQADLDLRGAKTWPPELVVEVLVARLAGRSRSGRSTQRSFPNRKFGN
jgi:DNA polymerase-3 subunit delta